MAYSGAYSASAGGHVIDVSDKMMDELRGRTCPQCTCRESRPLDSDNADDDDAAGLPLRVCVACNEVFGFDDSTIVPDHLLPDAEKNSYGGIWDCDGDKMADYPRPSSPCFRDAEAATDDWSSGNDDEAMGRNHDQHHSEFSDPPRRGRGRGRRRGGGGGGGHGRGKGNHQNRCNHHHHCGGGRGQRRSGDNGSQGGVQTSSNASDQLMQLATTCLQSGCKCALGATPDLAAGNYSGAVATMSEEMEPIGRAFGSAVGSVTGDLIGSPRAGELGAAMGSTVGRGVAEMLRDSSLCSRRTSSDRD